MEIQNDRRIDKGPESNNRNGDKVSSQDSRAFDHHSPFEGQNLQEIIIDNLCDEDLKLNTKK